MLVPVDPRAADLGAEVGIFGGSGFYDLLDDASDIEISTPYGSPAGPVRVGTLANRRVAFLPRHGTAHEFVAHRVPFRANVWSLAALGVRTVVAPCSVGSLQPHLEVADFVVVDQLVDRTYGREGTFHDTGPVHHQSFADPYDESVRQALLDAGTRLGGPTVHDGGTMVVINGPRFSTRAESQWYTSMGWDVVNMTGAPEAVLAAEAGMAYSSIALVTDRDASDGVTMSAVMETVSRNIENVKRLIELAVPELP